MFGQTKSKVDVRMFSITQATLLKDTIKEGKSVLEFAKEIADFVLGDAELPEYVSDDDTLAAISKMAFGNSKIYTSEKPSEPHTEPTSREA